MSRTSTSRLLAIGLFLMALPFSGCAADVGSDPSDMDEMDETLGSASQALTTCAAAQSFTFQRDEAQHLTIASLNGAPVAWFTDSAFTATMLGPERTFRWPAQDPTVTVTHSTWVRTLPRIYANTGTGAYSSAELTSWLNAARAVNCEDPEAGRADILALAFQYDEQSDDITEDGLVVAADAGYASGADFNDFLGISWKTPAGTKFDPDPGMLGDLDCSGFIRIVWGYRDNFPTASYTAKIPLTVGPRSGHIPRTAANMYSSAPGRVIVAARDGAPTDAELSRLRAGDLVFFETDSPANTADGSDHVGMFVGTSTHTPEGSETPETHYRFISSRDTMLGPTMGDGAAWSVFNTNSESSYYPSRFRAVRRF